MGGDRGDPGANPAMTQIQSASIFTVILCTIGTFSPNASAQRRPRVHAAGPHATSGHVLLPGLQVRLAVQLEPESITAVAPEGAIAPFGAPITVGPSSRLQLIASYDGTATSVQVRVNSGMGILRNYDDVAPANTPTEIAIDCLVEPPPTRGSSVVLAALTVVGRTTR